MKAMRFYITLVFILLIFISGCGFNAPRPRIGTLPTPPPGPRFADPDRLGKHSYNFNPFEVDAIVYTCNGGTIDLTHLRWNADYVKYLTEKTRDTLLKGGKGYHFNVTWEPSTHYITFEYPDNWQELPRDQKIRIADEVAFDAGPYITFNATLWHEIITWFGTKFAGFEAEFNSAFSWEDMYSNLLGIRLGIQALKSDMPYDQAMKVLIDQEMQILNAVPKKTAIDETEKMRGKWFTGVLHVDTKKRNMDVGYDGTITPTLIPDVQACPNPEPVVYKVPNLNNLNKQGFKMTHKIKPSVWEENKIFAVIEDQDPNSDNLKRINVQEHFPVIMEHIIDQAINKHNYDIDH